MKSPFTSSLNMIGRGASRAHAGERRIPIGDLDGIYDLVVCDDPDAVTLIAELLEAAGARVSTAASAD